MSCLPAYRLHAVEAKELLPCCMALIQQHEGNLGESRWWKDALQCTYCRMCDGMCLAAMHALFVCSSE